MFRPPRKDDLDIQFNLELRKYSHKVMLFINMTSKQICEKLGHGKTDHFFRVSSSQFALCTRETYLELIEHFKIDEMEGFLSYDTLVSMKEKQFNAPYTYNHGATVKREYVGSKNSLARDMYKNQPLEKKHESKAWENYPKNVLYFDVERGLHPTQKPVSLFEYLIKTYSNENDVVLDNCAGSGTTAIACINTNRRYICMERDEGYYQKSVERVVNHEPLLQFINQKS